MATQQTEEVSHATREPSAMEKTAVPTDAPQAKHARPSVENGGLTSSVEQHDHGGGFDGELDVSTKKQVHKEEPTQGKSKRSRLDSDGSAKTTETFDNDAEEGAKAGHAGSKADHAAATDAQTQLRQSMSTKQLQEKYHEVFGVPTKAHNKDWIINKISERVTLELPAADNSGPTPKSPSKRVAPTATAVQKRVRGTRKRAKRVSARRWMFRLVRSDVAGTTERTGDVPRWPCRATSTVRSTCGGRRRGGTSSSSSNPVERSVRVGSPLTQCPPERPVVCRFRFRPTSCRQVPRRTRCSRRRCCPLLPRRSRS